MPPFGSRFVDYYPIERSTLGPNSIMLHSNVVFIASSVQVGLLIFGIGDEKLGARLESHHFYKFNELNYTTSSPYNVPLFFQKQLD